ncbi:MAG: CNNM domain-containing protein [Wenzhouxiangellaceae bacterium]
MFLFVISVSVVLIVSFLCSIFESVLLSVTRPQIEILARDGRSAGALLADFKQNMDVPIAAILILNTAAHTVGAAVAGASYADVFDPATLWLFSLLFTLAVLLFTEIIPKTLGVSYASTLATPVAHGIHWLTIFLRPLVILSERISKALRGDAEAPVTSAEEIRLLALLGSSEGAVGRRTAGMIVGATQLRHLRVRDVMLPRGEVTFLNGTMNRDQALTIARESGHSRFPFSPTGELDDVTGMVLVKDLLHWLLAHDDEEIDWDAVRQDALVVPESSPLPQLLRTFQEGRRHLAIVVDEYGSVEGIATHEDVLEEIVGEINDESDQPIKEIVTRKDGTLLVDATVDLRKLSRRLGISWEPEEDVTTIGGLVTEMLERIPTPGDSVEWNGYRITVFRADRQRALVMTVKKTENA